MTERSSESLIEGLARELEPVRPIPRLRTVALSVLGVFAAVLGVYALLGGVLPLGASGVPWSDPVFLCVLAGLASTAGGGILAALAGAVPDREAEARRGRLVLAVGVLLVAAGALAGLLRADALEPALPIASSLQCGGRATVLGLVPALVVCVFLARAYERRPLLGAGAAALGALALGAVAVHTTCSGGGPLHLLIGHGLTPFAAALVLALPLSLLVRRRGG